MVVRYGVCALSYCLCSQFHTTTLYKMLTFGTSHSSGSEEISGNWNKGNYYEVKQ